MLLGKIGPIYLIIFTYTSKKVKHRCDFNRVFGKPVGSDPCDISYFGFDRLFDDKAVTLASTELVEVE
jgi:hypothetical protein